MRKVGALMSVGIMLLGVVIACLGAKMGELRDGAGMPAYLAAGLFFLGGLGLYTFWIYRMTKTGEL